MAAVTVAQLNRDGVLRVLATLYANPVEAQQLLYRLGADQTRLPHFGGSQTPFSTWFEVCRLIENGAFRFTLEDLLTEAAQDFPGNAVLRSVTAGLGPPPAEQALVAPPDDLTLAPPDDLTVLCLLAGPKEASRLQLRLEYRTIEEASRRGRERTLDIRLSAATRRQDVIPALTEHKPDVLHFGGHGAPSGHLLLEEDDGSVAPVTAEALATVLEAVGGVSVVVLNACHLGRYADVIAPHTQEVIGSPERLADQHALDFCRDYYAALAQGASWEGAFDRGRAGAGLGPLGLPDLRREVRAREGDTV